MILPRRLSPRRFFALALLTLLALTALFVPPALAQTAAPATATPAATGTPAPTRTPAPTPTATPTLTMRQSQLLLAQTYLDGGDYAAAVKLFAALAEQNPGDPTAVPGLKAALGAQATATAAASAAKPTAPPPAPTPAPTFGSTFTRQLRDFTGTGLAALVFILLLYLTSKVIRWLFVQLREVWWTRTGGVFDRIRKQPIPPGYYVGDFADATGDTSFPGGKVVAQVLTENLVQWHQAVMPEAPAVEPAPSLDLSGMSWVRLLWSWILPPPRVYRVTGTLLGQKSGPYELAISRTSLVKNRVDVSRTLGPAGGAPIAPEQAIRELATKALAWILDPLAAAAMDATERARLTPKGLAPLSLTPTQAMQEAMRLVILARQQLARAPADKAAVQGSLADTERALVALPADSTLRDQLQAAINELRGRIR